MVKSRLGNGFTAHWVRLSILIFSACLITMGCSSGGGGGSSSGLTYSGITTPAEITAENADDMAVGAFEAGSSGTAFTGIAAANDPSQTAGKPGRPLLIDFAKNMAGVIPAIDYTAASAQEVSAELRTESGSLPPGDCGTGSSGGSYNIQINTSTGAFSGSITFSGFCEAGLSVSGKASFSGSVNVNTEELRSSTLNFDSITASSETESVTLDGRIEMSASGSTYTAAMDMLIRDNNAGGVCKIEDYQMDISDGYGYSDVTVSGRFYDPLYGYVDLETEQALRIYDYDEYPSAGILIIEGQTGSAGGPTKARFSVIDQDSFQVEVDTNGDGTYDYQSGPILWDNV
jgi:hypothetical protein